MSKHKWTKDDDILACYVSKYGEDNEIAIKDICSSQDIKRGSFEMRVKNFNALAGRQNGLTNAAIISKKVFQEYTLIDKKNHKEHCISILNSK